MAMYGGLGEYFLAICAITGGGLTQPLPGVVQAVFTWGLSFCITYVCSLLPAFSHLITLFSFACLTASLNLFRAALKGVMRSPVSFFDTTPMGRVMSRLSKDQDTLDTEMSMVMFQVRVTLYQILVRH